MSSSLYPNHPDEIGWNLRVPLSDDTQSQGLRESRKNTWILADTWRLIGTSVSMCLDSVRNQGLL